MFLEMSCMKAFLTLLLCLVSNNHDSAMHDSVVSLSNTMPRKVSPNYVVPASSTSSSSANSYTVIFDAGSSATRVHVFCFDHHLNLVPIGNELELFVQGILYISAQDFCFDHHLNLVPIGKGVDFLSLLKPGLTGYYKAEAAARSLQWPLSQAEGVVPPDMHHRTPVKFGATADLRQLPGDKSERILQGVKDYLMDKSTLKTKADWITVLDETEEVAYKWVAINYLQGKLGKRYSDTVGVVDLEGRSVRMAYAISERDAAKTPRISKLEAPYVKEMYLMGTKYYLYVHSFMNYGLLAARAEILGIDKDSDNPCILAGYSGSYRYKGTTYKASASPSGPSVKRCREMVLKALNMNTTFTNMTRAFGGILNGKRGDGQKDLFLTSYFFYRAYEAGFIDEKVPSAKVSTSDFENAAKIACRTKFEDAKSRSKYPRLDWYDLPYLCMDLVYQFTLLMEGFAVDSWTELTLVKQVKYHNTLVDVGWPLGSAIETASSIN